MFHRPEYAYIYRGITVMVAFTIMVDILQSLVRIYLPLSSLNFIVFYINTFSLGILFALLITYGFLEGSTSIKISAIFLLAYFIMDYSRPLIVPHADVSFSALYGFLLLFLPITSRTLALFYYPNMLTRFLTLIFFVVGTASALITFHGLIYIHHPMKHIQFELLMMYLILSLLSSIMIFWYAKKHAQHQDEPVQ